MGNLKWIATPSTYRFADCEFGRYQIIGRGGQRLRVTDPVGVVLIHPEHRSIADAKAWAESDYARRVAKIAADNGYVKLADDEMIAKRLTSGEICFGSVNVDQVARKFGYVKLQPGQEIIERRILNALIDDHCVGCTFFAVEERDCATCDLKPIRDRITEARDE